MFLMYFLRLVCIVLYSIFKGLIIMQEISSKSVKVKGDQKFNILILQTATVALIMVFAVCIRIFGGSVYTKLSRLYHEKFDDITLASEVLNPKNNVSDVSSDNASSENGTSSSEQSQEEQSGEEYDADVDGDITGNITKYSDAKATAVAQQINTFHWPVYGTVTSHYGYRTNPITGVYSMHNGLDIASDTGTQIAAAYDGTVISASYSSSYGYYVIVAHSRNVQTLYAHCSELTVSEGDTVQKGDTVALVGSTGRSTGPHVHFEIRVGGYRIDPEWMLSEATAV